MCHVEILKTAVYIIDNQFALDKIKTPERK